MYACMLFSHLCLPRRGSCWRSCNYHKRDGPAPTPSGGQCATAQRCGLHPLVARRPEAAGARHQGPAGGRVGTTSSTNRLRTAAKYQPKGDDGRRAAGQLSSTLPIVHLFTSPGVSLSTAWPAATEFACVAGGEGHGFLGRSLSSDDWRCYYRPFPQGIDCTSILSFVVGQKLLVNSTSTPIICNFGVQVF